MRKLTLFLCFGISQLLISQNPQEWIQLFNGKDLSDWTIKIRGQKLNENLHNTFRVENGVLKTGYEGYDQFNEQFGHIYYKTPYSYYKLRAEYRFVGEQAKGGPGWAFRNSGFMLHCQAPETIGLDQNFPISIEVQLLGGNGKDKRSTANLCTPGTHVEKDGRLITRHCVGSESETYHGDQWVTVEVVVLGDSIIQHIVEGDTVLNYSKPMIGGGAVTDFDPMVKKDGKRLKSGYISLQSESHPVEFRKVELLDLAPVYQKKKIQVFKNANIVNGVSDQIKRNATLIVSDGKIQEVGEYDLAIPKGAKVYDLKGKYLMPGLIDGHVHIRNLASAKRALISGVTTARSMGVDHFSDVGMRQLLLDENIDAPEIIAAGYHVRPTPSDAFFMDFPELGHLKKEKVTTPAAVQIMASKMLDKGIDWIKTNATARAGLPHTDPREPYYDKEAMEALVKMGQYYKVPVAAHAHGDEGGRAAVLGGVRSIEHGTYLSETTLKLMKEKGTYLVPTVAIVADLKQPGGDYDIPLLQIRGRHMFPRIQETFKMAQKLGVKIVAATDTGYDGESTLRLSQEIELYVDMGMTPLQAIQSATSQAAEMLMMSDQIGQIKKGLDADLLILERNPLENIGAIHDPLMVVNNGKVIVNRLEW